MLGTVDHGELRLWTVRLWVRGGDATVTVSLFYTASSHPVPMDARPRGLIRSNGLAQEEQRRGRAGPREPVSKVSLRPYSPAK